MLKVLLTNDDGIRSSGIGELAQEMQKNAQVAVVAPDRERSATAHAITMHKPLRAEKVLMNGLGAEAWKINGTPSDCVKLALDVLLEDPPDMVISGINLGHNLGTDVIYSGTVSAAIEAALSGVPAMAISMAPEDIGHVSLCAELAIKLFGQIQKHVFPRDALLNVNIPSLGKGNLAGLHITRLGLRKYKNTFQKRKDPRGNYYYWMAGEPVDNIHDKGSDIWAINKGCVSVTPIQFDLTKYDIIEDLEDWGLKL